ncbi:hypothetical protein NL108_011396 [Boleophthalmus pectinirostris]|uniref:uncharacterized protein si:ch1073-220m6.1 n=1 Tax=Boleophthalmus pectinirostris TaxID=150288 RepID=UPI00242C631E|nr:uncharacterized protein si:ch1073-220m6.1 [Boleophthalmus pectinirostris]KAJ0055764.1 hypothetical protein NL108_011396 [Boleophthalmus pectinirostris]
MLLLLCQLFFMKISAEDATVTLYRMEGQSVCLDPGDQPPFESAKWTLGKKIIVSNDKMNPGFEKKMDYKPNSTLCINNLIEKDTGNYVFSHDRNFTSLEKTNRLIIQAAVPKPALSVIVEKANASTDVCIFAVNCSVQYQDELLWLKSECDKESCRSVNKSFPEINITISSHNRSLTCTSNNHVSSKEDSREIDGFCFSPRREETPTWSVSKDVNWILIVICSVTAGGLFILFCFGAMFIVARRKKQPRVIQSQPFEQPSQPRTSTSSTQANSYENMDSENSNETSDQETENVKPQTVYCVLEPRPSSEEPRDQPDQTHTVYSVIKMPQI